MTDMVAKRKFMLGGIFTAWSEPGSSRRIAMLAGDDLACL
jgi:hypothetical protein